MERYQLMFWTGWSAEPNSVTVDTRAQMDFTGIRGPKMKNLPGVVSVWWVFFQFFPMELVRLICELTTLAGRDKFREGWGVTEDDFWTWLAVRIVMMVNGLGKPSAYFGPISHPFRAHIDLSEYVSFTKFDEISRALKLPTWGNPDDPHDALRRLVDTLNTR